MLICVASIELFSPVLSSSTMALNRERNEFRNEHSFSKPSSSTSSSSSEDSTTFLFWDFFISNEVLDKSSLAVVEAGMSLVRYARSKDFFLFGFTVDADVSSMWVSACEGGLSFGLQKSQGYQQSMKLFHHLQPTFSLVFSRDEREADTDS